MVDIVPHEYQLEKYVLKVRTHIISNFKKEAWFKNNFDDPKHTVHGTSFKIDRNGIGIPPSGQGDYSITIDEIEQIAFKHIKECADASYNIEARDVVIVEFIVESQDKTHVTEIGIFSRPDNVPMFNNPNTFSRSVK